MKAVNLKQVDLDYRNHLQAYLSVTAKATKKVGKKEVPVYKSFKQFYNYEKEVEKVLNKNNSKEQSRFPGIGKLLKKGG